MTTYEEIEAAYEAVTMGAQEPDLIIVPARMVVAARILAGHKYPRKMKKWAIGLRGSLRRFCAENTARAMGIR